ncbi:Clp protease N-terminal domain-containing protein [Kitasatospora sp. HPMI-4]|uniref:Clp protease N-terminal domain-containing protein n=1 Tax=Kitasatospora sp. HPMI-4 TaxID=3448443 RepID=UPI003F1C3F3D
MFERFTEGARRTVVLAREESRRLRHGFIGTEHLLLGVLGQPQDRAAAVLEGAGFDLVTARGAVARLLGAPHPDVDGAALASIGVDLDAIREAVEASFGAGALDAAPVPAKRRRRIGAPRFTDRAKRALSLGLEEAVRLGGGRIEAGHILLGLLREGGGVAVLAIREYGLDPAAVQQAVARALAAEAA